MKTILRYPGGKSRLAKQIVGQFPNYVERYYEPFLGGGSVFLEALQRNVAEKEYYINDLNINLFLFWQYVISEPETLSAKIKEIISQCPDGKRLFREAREMLTSFSSSLVELASYFYVLNRISFSGTTESGGFSPTAFRERLPDVEKIREKILDLSDFIRGRCDNRLVDNITDKGFYSFGSLVVCSDNYIDFLNHSKIGKQDLVYLDPPYDVKSKSLYGRNGHLHNGFDFAQFSEVVKKLPCRFILSFNDCDWIRKEFSEYKIVSVYGYKYSMQKKSGRELLIRNY